MFKILWEMYFHLVLDHLGLHGFVNLFSIHPYFRWVCASGLASDLHETDTIAQDIIKQLISNKNSMYRI